MKKNKKPQNSSRVIKVKLPNNNLFTENFLRQPIKIETIKRAINKRTKQNPISLRGNISKIINFQKSFNAKISIGERDTIIEVPKNQITSAKVGDAVKITFETTGDNFKGRIISIPSASSLSSQRLGSMGGTNDDGPEIK